MPKVPQPHTAARVYFEFSWVMGVNCIVSSIMGRYISIWIRFEGANLATRVLEPVFASSFFKPVTLGGICGLRDGEHWFLGGYALEDYIELFTRPGSKRKVTSIELAANLEDPEYPYLLNRAEDISKLRCPKLEQSPFETIDFSAGVSFLKQVRLNKVVLEKCHQWLQQFPSQELKLYGTVNVAVREPDNSPWHEAYRILYPEEYRQESGWLGIPFLFIHASTTPISPNETEVMLYGCSEIWLRDSQELNGRVGPQEADENLANLVALTELIAHSQTARLLSVELHTEGKTFYHESERLKSAFADILTD